MQDQGENEESPSPIAFAEGCVCFTLRRAARAITQLYDGHLVATGLKATQFSLLVAIGSYGPIAMQALAERMGMDRTTLSRNLMPLGRAGFIDIGTGADKRCHLVKITAAGHAKVIEGIPMWQRAQAEAVARFGGDRWREVRALLNSAAAV